MLCGQKHAEACEACEACEAAGQGCTHGPTTRKSKHHDISQHVHTTTKRIISDLIFAFFTRNHALILHLCRAAVPTATSAARSTSPTLSLHRSLNAPGLAYIPADVASVCVGRSKGYPKASKASTPSNNNNPIQLSSSKMALGQYRETHWS